MKRNAPLSFLGKFRRAKNGATAVEFAIILPVFIVMIFGTMELANMLYAKSTLQHGIETAGRYAMVHIDASISEIQAEAIANSDHLKTLSPTFSVAKQVVDGIPFSVISVTGEYTVLTPIFTGRKIKFTSQLSVPLTKPEDFS